MQSTCGCLPRVAAQLMLDVAARQAERELLHFILYLEGDNKFFRSKKIEEDVQTTSSVKSQFATLKLAPGVKAAKTASAQQRLQRPTSACGPWPLDAVGPAKTVCMGSCQLCSVGQCRRARRSSAILMVLSAAPETLTVVHFGGTRLLHVCDAGSAQQHKCTLCCINGATKPAQAFFSPPAWA